MSLPKQDGVYLLRIEQPLTRDHSTALASALSSALAEAGSSSALRIDLASPESPDAPGLAVLLAAAKEARTRSVDLRLRLPKELSELAEDLRLAKHAAVEIKEGRP